MMGNLVIELAKDAFPVEERNLSVEGLRSATEAFVTSTDKEIMPVVKIDDFQIGNGKVGKNTKRIMKMFQDYVLNYIG